MEEKRQLPGERAWSAIERMLIALTFGCFGLMALAVCVLSMEQLADSEGTWRSKLVSVLLPFLAAAALPLFDVYRGVPNDSAVHGRPLGALERTRGKGPAKYLMILRKMI